MADATREQSQKNWFEENPKKTLVLIFLIFLVAATWAAEKVLAHHNHSLNRVLFTERRYINLREFQPSIDVVYTPTDKEVAESDSLVKKAYRVRTDANGLLLPYNRYPHPDLTLAFLGGSTVACLYVEEENRYPYLVGNLIEKATGDKVTSYNSGVGGNNSLHSLDILLNKLIPLHPDVVVMMHNINDLVSLIYDQTYWSNNPSRAPIIDYKLYKNLTGMKAIATLARDTYIPNLHLAFRSLCKKVAATFGRKVRDPEDEFAKERGRKIVFDPARILDEFRMNLQTFINICRARQITPVLMTQFNRYKSNPDEKIRQAMKGFESGTGISAQEFKEIYDKFNEATVEVGRRNGVLVIDLARLIPQEAKYMYDEVHLNTAGSRLAAQIISEQLLPVAMLKKLPGRGETPK
ncbi:MAG: SGNH/GDSL hydrolase family protein [Desulfobaccales bacterium]